MSVYDNLIKQLNDMENIFIKEKHSKDILNKFHTLKKNIIKFVMLSNDKSSIDILNNKLKLIEDYLDNKTALDTNNKLDFLTILNTIFLPLGFIVGFFGMNFYVMGGQTTGKGIYSSKNGYSIIIKSFLLSIVIIIMLLKYFY